MMGTWLAKLEPHINISHAWEARLFLFAHNHYVVTELYPES